MLAVMLEFVDRFADVGQRGVRLLLLEAFDDLASSAWPAPSGC